MNFIKEFHDKKERKENLQELVLEGIEDEHYKYVVDHMITKCLKDINNYEDLRLENEYTICFHFFKGQDNKQSLRVIHHNVNDNDTFLHRTLKLNLETEELNFFYKHILDSLKNYDINTIVNQNPYITSIIAKTTLKNWYNFYYQELQKIEYESNKKHK